MSALPWIKVYNDLPEHPKSDALSEATGIPRAWTHVLELWLWCSRSRPDGDLSGMSDELIARRSGVLKGHGRFVAALRSCGWLDPDNRLHDWAYEQSAHAERLRKDRERKAVAAEKRKAGAGARSAGTSTGIPQERSAEAPQETPPEMPLRASAREDLRSEILERDLKHIHAHAREAAGSAPVERPVCVWSPSVWEVHKPGGASPQACATVGNAALRMEPCPQPDKPPPRLVVHEGGLCQTHAEQAWRVYAELLAPRGVQATRDRLRVLAAACERRGLDTIVRHIEGLAGHPWTERAKLPAFDGLWHDAFVDRGLALRDDRKWRTPYRKPPAPPPAPAPEPIPDGPRRAVSELIGAAPRAWDTPAGVMPAPRPRESRSDLSKVDPDALARRRSELRQQARALAATTQEHA